MNKPAQLAMSGHIVYRIDASVRCGILPAINPTDVQIWSSIGDGRFIDATRAYLAAQAAA